MTSYRRFLVEAARAFGSAMADRPVWNATKPFVTGALCGCFSTTCIQPIDMVMESARPHGDEVRKLQCCIFKVWLYQCWLYESWLCQF